jgi:hypothetical protein
MNHLHEVVESKTRHGSESLSDDLVLGGWEILHTGAQRAVCFDLGDLQGFVGMRFDETNIARPPYADCWFEATFTPPNSTKPHVVGLMLVTRQDGKIAGALAIRNSTGTWAIHSRMLIEDFCNAGTYKVAPAAGVDTDYAEGFFGTLQIFLQALRCVNVERKRVTPPPKLQAARARRGKLPLFSYWTLELRPHAEAEQLGGTHSSPRLHLRRGHCREYALGKWCWVQPHVVGNKALGMVHKDYRATPELLSHAARLTP